MGVSVPGEWYHSVLLVGFFALTLHLSLVSAADNDDAFDELRARQIVNLTQAAYCTDLLGNWSCTVCENFPGMTNVSILQGQSRNVRGFIGVDTFVDSRAIVAGEEEDGGNDFIEKVTEDEAIDPGGIVLGLKEDRVRAGVAAVSRRRRRRRQLQHCADFSAANDDREGQFSLPPSGSGSGRPPQIVVTFSGTDPKSVKNWIDDLEAAPIAHSYGHIGADCEDCKVHRGFLAAYEVVQDQVRAAVINHLRYNPTAEVLITGHSLGGALATLCLLDLHELLLGRVEGAAASAATADDIITPTVSFAPLYIFGAPRVGNAAFATYSASLGVPIYRVVHNRDPVPHLPFESWGYAHPPQEVFFDAPQTSHVVCSDKTGEDPTCSDKFWVLPTLAHVLDHLHYLEVEYTKAYMKCLIGRNEKHGDEDEAAAEGEDGTAGAAAAMTAGWEREWEGAFDGLQGLSAGGM